MRDYSKAVIYKIVCRDLEIKDLYVGSTTNIAVRRKGHSIAVKKSDFHVYQFIRAHGGWDNWEIIVIEEYPCASKKQLLVRERNYIEQLGAHLNMQIPTRTVAEWVAAHRELTLSRQALWYQENKADQQAKMKQYRAEKRDIIDRKATCECGRIVCHRYLSSHRTTAAHKSQMAAKQQSEETADDTTVGPLEREAERDIVTNGSG